MRNLCELASLASFEHLWTLVTSLDKAPMSTPESIQMREPPTQRLSLCVCFYCWDVNKEQPTAVFW